MGDPSFAAALTEANVRVYRFVNNRDVVPRIPAVNYQHAGVLLWLRHKKKQKVTASGAEAAAATREHQPRSAASSSAAATNSKAAPVVGRVDVYASGTEAPCNQQCLCCNLNVMDHVISFEEVENADGSVSTVPCVGAFEPACGGWNPLWSTGPLPSPTGATAGADDAQLRRAATHAEVMNVHFNGYMQVCVACASWWWLGGIFVWSCEEHLSRATEQHRRTMTLTSAVVVCCRRRALARPSRPSSRSPMRTGRIARHGAVPAAKKSRPAALFSAPREKKKKRRGFRSALAAAVYDAEE